MHTRFVKKLNLKSKMNFLYPSKVFDYKSFLLSFKPSGTHPMALTPCINPWCLSLDPEFIINFHVKVLIKRWIFPVKLF